MPRRATAGRPAPLRGSSAARRPGRSGRSPAHRPCRSLVTIARPSPVQVGRSDPDPSSLTSPVARSRTPIRNGGSPAAPSPVTTARRVPSGLQLGHPTGPSWSTDDGPPSASTTQMAPSESRSGERTYAIRSPSGDQVKPKASPASTHPVQPSSRRGPGRGRRCRTRTRTTRRRGRSGRRSGSRPETIGAGCRTPSRTSAAPGGSRPGRRRTARG